MTAKQSTINDILSRIRGSYLPESGVYQNSKRALNKLSRQELQSIYAMVLTSTHAPLCGTDAEITQEEKHDRIATETILNPYKFSERYPDLDEEFADDFLNEHCATIIKDEVVSKLESDPNFNDDDLAYWDQYECEAQDQDGYGYWQKFANADEVIADFLDYFRAATDAE